MNTVVKDYFHKWRNKMDLSSVVFLDIIITTILKVLGIACAFKYLVKA